MQSRPKPLSTKAARWFILNAEYIAYPDTWLQDIHQILNDKPKAGEQASSYPLRIRNSAGSEWNSPCDVSDYIDVWGKPESFKPLNKMIVEFERKRDGMSRACAKISVPKTKKVAQRAYGLSSVSKIR